MVGRPPLIQRKPINYRPQEESKTNLALGGDFSLAGTHLLGTPTTQASSEIQQNYSINPRRFAGNPPEEEKK